MAMHHSFSTDVAEIAEVSVEDGQIRVHKVTLRGRLWSGG
jgi:CO/xanthine dehydrogenase Mo-binding subunit